MIYCTKRTFDVSHHHVINGKYNPLSLANNHPVSVATHDDSEHAQFTQPFTATYNPHCPHLVPVQEVCPKGLTQLLHYLLVAIASCKQNCSAAILKEGCKNRRYMKWALVRWKQGSITSEEAHNGRVLIAHIKTEEVTTYSVTPAPTLTANGRETTWKTITICIMCI